MDASGCVCIRVHAAPSCAPAEALRVTRSHNLHRADVSPFIWRRRPSGVSPLGGDGGGGASSPSPAMALPARRPLVYRSNYHLWSPAM